MPYHGHEFYIPNYAHRNTYRGGLYQRMLEQLQEIQDNRIMPPLTNLEAIEEQTFDEEVEAATTHDLKTLLKLRHLDRLERRKLHSPKPDWEETPAGEKCKDTNSLVVSDIINKYSKK